jgi:hypothetical protein
MLLRNIFCKQGIDGIEDVVLDPLGTPFYDSTRRLQIVPYSNEVFPIRYPPRTREAYP